MANEEHVSILNAGIADWNSWRKRNPGLGPDLSDIDLKERKLFGVDFSSTNLYGADFTDAYLKGADLTGASCVLADFQNASLAGATLTNADFSSAYGLEDVWDLGRARFGEDHRHREDGSDHLSIRRLRDLLLNWGRLRTIGQLPLFGVSWFSLIASVTTLNTIGWLNSTRFIEDWVEYPIPLPQRMMWLILSSIALVLGSTLYRLACPTRIQEFSETQFVEEHRQPRLLYLADSWSRRGLQWPTLVLTVVGGISGLVLAGERVYAAIVYVLAG